LHLSSKVHLFLCNWYRMIADVYPTIFAAKDDHAGEMETSLGLAHFGELVEPERADAGAVRASRFEAVNRGWIEITRPWHVLTTNSGAGDPRAATAAKGQAITEILAERIGGFLVELAASRVDESFPL
jgi:creatinine amidohydrolase